MKTYTKLGGIEYIWHGRKPVLIEFVKVGNETMVLSPRRIKGLGMRNSKPFAVSQDIDIAFNKLINGV